MIRTALTTLVMLVAAGSAGSAQSAAPATPGAPAATHGALPAPLDPKSNGLFKRMEALNAGLQSYHATFTFDVAMKTFPYISPSLDGDLYYKKPDKQAVVFNTVPALASQFKKIYPNLDPPDRWPAKYEVAVMSDDGTTTLFRLVPKVNGRVEHLDVKVDDGAATVGEMTWTYKDGGYVTFDQTFQKIGQNELPQKLTGHVELPAYKADVSSAIKQYQINVAVDPALFDAK